MLEGIIITGLISSGVYALLAIGFSLIFGAARIINLTHTAFYMLTAYLIYTLTSSFDLNPVLSIIISIVAVTIIGVLVYKFVIERVRAHEATVLIVTIALAVIIQEAVLLAFGGHFRGVSSLISGYTTILGVKVTYQYLLTFGAVFIVLFGTWALLMKTRLGIAIRATAQDRAIANLMGINVSRIGMITMGIAVALAAIAGALVAPLFTLTPYMWMHPLVMVLAVVVLGGLGSIKGSFVGALILGFTETLVVFLVPMGAFLKGAVALAIMLVIILIRPEGLFGVSFEEER
ncbi:MAG: branched-chain amino acid ABC transporter permease [Dehalococcoidia bacterium]|nr:branched-chain amino acid ABC transporter permease [Dehalococcoidia bacterium]